MTRRMDAVLRVRALREQLARADIAAERAALEEQLNAEHAAWEHLRSISDAAVITPQQLLMHRARLKSGLDAAERSGARVLDGRQRVGTATALWQEAAQRLDGAERLVERQETAARAAAERAEYTELDDLVVTRWPHTAAGPAAGGSAPQHPNGSTP